MRLEQTIKKIGWKVSGFSPDLASVRYRAILPMVSLEKVGVESIIISSVFGVNIAEFDAVIIVKSFTSDDLYLAQQARKNDVPVFFDLCDNIFIEGYKGKQVVTPSEMFFAISPYLSGVLVTTQPLKAVVEKVLNFSIPVHVVPDGIETKRDVEVAKKILGKVLKSEIKKSIRSLAKTIANDSVANIASGTQKIKILKHHLKANFKTYLKPLTWVKKVYIAYDLARSSLMGAPRKAGKTFRFSSNEIFHSGNPIKRSALIPSARRILWFGNHGAKYAQFGILDLLPLRNAIEKVNKEIPVELIVVSNNREKFIKYISRFDCTTRYIEWSADAVDAILKIADVVIVPNSKDDFSICKSSNRTVMSINAGVPVVADMTPSLEELEKAIYCDDFYEGIKSCLVNVKEARKKVALGKEIIKHKYGKDAIAGAFQNAFGNFSQKDMLKVPENPVLILLNLIQDLELAKPIISKLEGLRSPFVVWISFSLARKAPAILSYLREKNILYFCLPDEVALLKPGLFQVEKVRSLVTFAETNLGPHTFTHSLTKCANEANIPTFTIQHGYENVGLTYSDEVHNIQKISIAAKNILIWGEISTLHPEASPSIIQRITSIGCPKEVGVFSSQVTPLDEIDSRVIGIFENLHWHRYSENYREQFLKSVKLCADKYPDIIFFIKPHPAGMWLTSRFKGSVPTAENIIIADPLSPSWDKYSINDFWKKMSAVISTPSTVILDAVREGLPTLVCGFDLQLENYSPLFIAKSTQEWFQFIDQLQDGNIQSLKEANQQFLNRTLVEGDAATRIAGLLMAS